MNAEKLNGTLDNELVEYVRRCIADKNDRILTTEPGEWEEARFTADEVVDILRRWTKYAQGRLDGSLAKKLKDLLEETEA